MTEQPTAPRTRRTPDTCSKCGAPGYRIVDDSGDGSVRFERAAASVPAPEQEEAVRPGVVRWTFPKDSVIFNGDGSVSVPAPEQEEAVRLLRNDGPLMTLLDRYAEASRRVGYARRDAPEAVPKLAARESAIRVEIVDAIKDVRAALATPPPVPATLWRLQGEYVVDRDGLVWRVVRDGGMATRADFTGIESIGIETLRSTKGPLTSLNDFVRSARMGTGASSWSGLRRSYSAASRSAASLPRWDLGDPRPKLSNEHRSGMDAIGRLDERVPPDENGRVVIREAHLIDPETGDEWPFNADAWKERDRQRRNAVLDEIEQRVRAAEATITQHSWDEPPTIVWDAIKREDILAIIEDMRRGG